MTHHSLLARVHAHVPTTSHNDGEDRDHSRCSDAKPEEETAGDDDDDDDNDDDDDDDDKGIR